MLPSSGAMPPPRTSLAGFLRAAKGVLNNAIHQSSPVQFVVGNESAGLSIFSILVDHRISMKMPSTAGLIMS